MRELFAGLRDAGHAADGTAGIRGRYVLMSPEEIKKDQLSRTDLAEDRTLLASERTFASWTRTSLGCIAIGIGFHALFASMQPPWVPRAIASIFLLLGAAIVWLASGRAAAVVRRLNPHVIINARKVNLEVIAVAVSLGALALALAVWLLPVGKP